MLEGIISPGGTIYILGSGPSLDGFNYSLLDGQKVIAINNAGVLQYPFATVLLSTDERWCADAGQEAFYYKGQAVVCSEPVHFWPKGDDRLRRIKRERRFGLSANPDIIYGIYTGVHAAINLAAHCKPERIVLLGVDLMTAGTRKYTYGGTMTPRTLGQFGNMKKALESTVEPLKKRKIEVINASPQSALECWERCAREDVFD